MSHRDPVAHSDPVLVTHAVEYAAILHVGVGSDADGKDVATDHSVHPDARVLANLHVADDLRVLVDVARFMYTRRDALIGAKQYPKTFIGTIHPHPTASVSIPY